MNGNRIEQFLKETDRQRIIQPIDPAELAARVLRTTQRRRSARRITVMLLLIGMIGAATLDHLTKAPVPQVASVLVQPTQQQAQDELSGIQQEIVMREAMLRRLEAIERRSALAAQISAVPVMAPEDQVIERAAAVVLFQGDRMLSEGEDPQDAARAYHEVIAYFPGANVAQAARQRIAQLNKAG